MRILFCATGEIAIPLLRSLFKEGLIGAVFTSPDATGKRGKGLIPPPIKVEAEKLGISVSQPERLGKAARVEAMLTGCDTLLSFSYGKIFGPKFLSLFERKYNVHPSLLPKYRGSSPLQATLLNGELNSGITLQEIALGIDEGDIISTFPFSLIGDEDLTTLSDKVSNWASDFVTNTLLNIDSFPPKKQEGEPSYTKLIEKEEGKLDFSKSAKELHMQIRANYPWPKAFCTFRDGVLYICKVYGKLDDIVMETCAEEPGTVVSYEKKKGLKVATGNGYLYISHLQLPTKKELDAQSFINGNKEIINRVLG